MQPQPREAWTSTCPTRSWSSQNHRVGLHSARPARKASGTSGRTRSSAGPGAVPSATDGKVRLSIWQGFHLCGAWASGLQGTACTPTHWELWRHRDLNPCAVPGQTSGISPSATHLRICSGQSMDNFFNLWPPEMLLVFITGQWHLYSFWTFIHRFGYRNWKYRLTFVFNLAFGYRQGCLYIYI